MASATDAVGDEDGSEGIPVDRPSAKGSSVSLAVILVVCGVLLVFFIVVLVWISFGGRRQVYVDQNFGVLKIQQLLLRLLSSLCVGGGGGGGRGFSSYTHMG